MTLEEINHIKYMVCCPMCDNEKCVRKTDKCEAEIWAKDKAGRERGNETARFSITDFCQMDNLYSND